jgi:hypothetical protein
MVVGALVLGVVFLLIGCAWTALRYRRAHQAALPRLAGRVMQLPDHPVPEQAATREAA